MKKIIKLLTMLMLMLLPLNGIVWADTGQKKVNIGLLLDGNEERNTPFISFLRSELDALLGSSYKIGVSDNHILKGQWNFSVIEDNYDQLISNPDVHIIVGAGAITGSIISKKKEYKKPVIAIGIVDSIVQGVTPLTNNKSGVHNLTYIMSSRSIIDDLDIFHKVHPYKRLGFIFYDEFSKTMTSAGRQKIEHLMNKKDSTFIKIPVQQSIDEVFENLDKVDAVYISYLGKFEDQDKKYLIEQLNRRKVPSFGDSIEDTRAGVLAAMVPDDILKKIVRRISLNIEAILEGQNPSDINVYTEFENHLTINMKTAFQIGFSPKFTILSQAELINEHYIEAKRKVNLKDVMLEALQKNLDIEVFKTFVKEAQQDIYRAKTDYFPYLSANLNGIIIDEKRAETSNGTQSEMTGSGNITASQLIYSDQVTGSIKSREHLLKASKFDLRNNELDVVLKAIDAYFKILKAKTSRKILKDNLNLIKQNLKTAKQREVIGYSGRSDVLRWQSKLATSSTELLAADQEVILSKNELNSILNRNQDELFHIKDTAMNDKIFSIYAADAIEKHIDNQKSLDIFTRFFINKCIENSVEIEKLNATSSSFERTLSSLKKKHYLPTINFKASQDHIFSREGEGSDVSGANPVDNPWSAGVYMNLPFFEGGSRSVDIQKTILEISRINKQKLILSQQIENNARIVLSEAIVKMVNLETSGQAAAYAKQSLELVQDSYAKGAVSVVELADAQNNALTAQLSATSSIYEYLISLFTMERVYGKFTLLMPLDSKERIAQKFKDYINKSTN